MTRYRPEFLSALAEALSPESLAHLGRQIAYLETLRPGDVIRITPKEATGIDEIGLQETEVTFLRLSTPDRAPIVRFRNATFAAFVDELVVPEGFDR